MTLFFNDDIVEKRYLFTFLKHDIFKIYVSSVKYTGKHSAICSLETCSVAQLV